MKQTLQDDQEKMLKYIQIRYLQALMNEKKKKKGKIWDYVIES